MKTAGDAILLQLKSLGEAQAETLARRLRVSVQAVRQRLERRLVVYSDRAHGRGRPRRLWSLAPGASALFPDTHAQLTVDLTNAWAAFMEDREWAEIKHVTSAQTGALAGKIEDRLLVPTQYSPRWQP